MQPCFPRATVLDIHTLLDEALGSAGRVLSF